MPKNPYDDYIENSQCSLHLFGFGLLDVASLPNSSSNIFGFANIDFVQETEFHIYLLKLFSFQVKKIGCASRAREYFPHIAKYT
jgi:hypothetical protein